LTDQTQPKGAFLFVGPTGVGKTESTLQFTDYFFGRESLARFDMSEFKELGSISAFLRRIQAAVKVGCRVILFDEMEKASKEIHDLFLQMIDAARITFADDTVGDLRNTYLIFTSNIGAREAMQSQTRNRVAFEKTIKAKLAKELRPEFIGRYERAGGIVIFDRLTADAQFEVAEVAVRRMEKRMNSLGYPLVLTEQAKTFVFRNGFHPDYGARPLLGVLNKGVEGAIRDALFNHVFREGMRGEIHVAQCGSRLEYRPVKAEPIPARDTLAVVA
jgi:ATP-dependent Clp protease ATP-binding subunit ClpB